MVTKVKTGVLADDAVTVLQLPARITANIKINSLRIASLEDGNINNQVDGTVDAYTDESGINTGSSTNETYNSGSNFYENSGGAEAIDKNFSAATGSNFPLGQGANLTNAISFLAGATGKFTKATLRYRVATGSPTGNITAYLYDDTGSNNPGNRLATLSVINSASLTGSFAEYSHTISAESAPDITNGTKYWVLFSKSSDGSNYVHNDHNTSNPVGDSELKTNGAVGEPADPAGVFTNPDTYDGYLKTYVTPGPINMTLISNTFPSETDPTTIEFLGIHKPVDSVTINTDYTVELSRDGGSNYSTVTLTDEGEFETGINILRGSVNVSAQPAGSNIILRQKTLNSKGQQLHGIVLGWS